MVNILYVEDDEMCRILGLKVFEILKHLNVSAVTNGTDALALSKNNDYDLIVLDLTLPDMSGSSLAYQMRMEKDNLPPIVAITAELEEGSEAPNSIDKLYVKPLTYDKLQEILTLIEA